MSKSPDTVVLLVNLGTPSEATPAAVREFLREFLSDPMVVDYPRFFWQPLLERVILRSRPTRVARLYTEIAGNDGLPLAVGTRRIATALAQTLGNGFAVRPCYRYGTPAFAAELRGALVDKGKSTIVVPLFPQRTSSSSETIVELARTIARSSGAEERVLLHRIQPTDPGYVEALASRVLEAGVPGHLVASFHGIPKRYDRREAGRYKADCRATTRALVERLGIPPERVTLCYQSRFGPEPWIGPATFAELRKLAASGVREVGVITPGFVTEGLETLEEIAVRARDLFLEAGGRGFRAIPAVDCHPAFVGSLAAGLRAARAAPKESTSASVC